MSDPEPTGGVIAQKARTGGGAPEWPREATHKDGHMADGTVPTDTPDITSSSPKPAMRTQAYVRDDEAEFGAMERDSYASTALSEILDRATHASLAKLTFGLSPASLMGAYLDWMTHLTAAPGKRLQLAEKAIRKWIKIQRYATTCALAQGQKAPCIEPLPQDKRFSSPAWQHFPFNVMYQAHLLAQQWWHVATTDIPGLSADHERMVEFTARQILDVWSPSNFWATNPDVLSAAWSENGQNFVRGAEHLVDDWERLTSGRPPAGVEAFRPGKDVAITPGKVVLRTRLMELIQYQPATPKVHAEPILIVPAWIMKYYILDLSPTNSLVKYLVDQGYTVFIMSWKNPGPTMRDVSLDEYRRDGILAALDAIKTIVPGQKIHAAGYCLGGTLLAITAAALARDETSASPLKSLSFLAAQVDFTEPGELQLFINDSQLQFLEDMMWEQGFLDAKQMSGAFQILRSNDLIWSRMMSEYLLGKRAPMTDLMAWNADTTRMPYKMHSEYLRKLYLNNDLVEGRYQVDGRPITLADIRQPLFVVGTTKDHVAPWRSVYKWTTLADTTVTFVLAEGGHNAGIVSEPGHPRRGYQISTHTDGDLHVDPVSWAARMPRHDGSWWQAWSQWLEERSSPQIDPPEMGARDKGLPPDIDAPGTYVLES